jgi:hypothetical protein
MNRRELLGSVGAASLLPTAFALPTQSRPSPAFQAALRLGPVHSGAGNHQWAEIVAGSLAGRRLDGRVQSGRMDWYVDPCSGALEIAMHCRVARSDGSLVELRDRTASASASDRADFPGHRTAPSLSGSTAEAPLRLVGRLDTTSFWRGFVSLRAFETV